MGEIKPLDLSPGKAAKWLGLSRTKIMSLIQSGRLSATVLDNRIRVTMQSIEALRASQPSYMPGQMPDLHPRNPLPKKRRGAA